MLSFRELRQTHGCGGPENITQFEPFTQETSAGLQTCGFPYPKINLRDEGDNSESGLDQVDRTWGDVLVPVNESALKRVVGTFFERGFLESLEIARSDDTASRNPFLANVAECIYKTLTYLEKCKSCMIPTKWMTNTFCVEKHLETRDWKSSYIRYIAWHPETYRLAVAAHNDNILVHLIDLHKSLILKNCLQKNVTCIAWRPHTTAELAVGCSRGVCLWTIHNSNDVYNFTGTGSHLTQLHEGRHRPITSIQWDTDGVCLATASIADSDIIVWHVDTKRCTRLKRVGPPCALIKWSPDGALMFTSTVGNVFRVWSTTQKWEPERWTITSGYVLSACWSPCSNFILFITSEQNVLYCLEFLNERVLKNESEAVTALPIVSFSQMEVGGTVTCGMPQALAWDPTGVYLAVSFKDINSVIIYSTSIQKFRLNISSQCYISSPSTEDFPNFICFQSVNNLNNATILTVGWSNGRVSYYPLN